MRRPLEDGGQLPVPVRQGLAAVEFIRHDLFRFVPLVLGGRPPVGSSPVGDCMNRLVREPRRSNSFKSLAYFPSYPWAAMSAAHRRGKWS